MRRNLKNCDPVHLSKPLGDEISYQFTTILFWFNENLSLLKWFTYALTPKIILRDEFLTALNLTS